MKKISFFIVLLSLVAFSMHKFHLSNTKIVFNKEEKALQITIRCFVDDIENTLNNTNNIVLELGNNRELKNADKHLKKYLLENFELTINNTKHSINYLGKEIEKDIIFFYLEIESIKSISTIKIKNKILLETFNDQQNVIRLKINDTKKTFVLKEHHFSDELQF